MAKAAAKKVSATKKSVRRSMPKEGRDPKGGLTEAGRAWYAAKTGANLKPGVKGPPDTPEKMRRKGSFLVRMFTNPRGPMQDAKGRPTRLALSAQAWGEKLPKTMHEAHMLAAEGRRLLAQYHVAKKAAAKIAIAKKSAVKKVSAKKAAAKKSAVKKSASKPAARKAKS
ncbi:DUF6321 domain-containing protein [Terriglobus roseus]|uniref:DUF6321 domain-containing protein n=1 Tax=Terriglobus roseus TaxID=392734 RepID=A0A1G7GJ55_9BACT|nr:DUF6321 domain-containing protein [Terriglobus roseus]SDE88131.1 hypothetical protein SAMN05444167_0714 [Terriglobus roseus]